LSGMDRIGTAGSAMAQMFGAGCPQDA